MRFEDILEACAYARPGYTLAAFKEAALPVYQLTTRVITLERKQISPIEEACLKSVDAGLDNPDDIRKFLGLPMQVVKGVLVSLNSREQINYIRPVGSDRARVILTSRGRLAIEQAEIIEPDERLVKITFDPHLKRVVYLQSAALFRPKEVRDNGWLEIPLCGAKRPEVEDIPLADIDKAIRKLGRGHEEVRELLSIRRVERRELLFVSCVALFYRSNDHKEVHVGFYKDEGFAVEHENAFAAVDGPTAIGAMHVLQPQQLPRIDEASTLVRQALATEAEVEAIEQIIVAASSANIEQERGSRGIENASISSGEVQMQQEAERAKEQLRRLTQRLLRCHEHPKFLRDAITKASKRLLIIAPWIRHQVVDSIFVSCLEALLRNGVEIYIGYGISDEGPVKDQGKPQITPQAKVELEKLQTRFDNLTWKFVGNTHRKMMVCDDRFAIITSFNWLSFRGDPRGKARDEGGYLFSEPSAVEEIFQDCLKLIEEGYDHPANRDGRGKQPVRIKGATH